MSVGSAWSRTREGHGRRGRRRLPALTSGSPWRSSQPRLRTGVGHRGLGHPLRPGSEETLVLSRGPSRSHLLFLPCNATQCHREAALPAPSTHPERWHLGCVSSGDKGHETWGGAGLAQEGCCLWWSALPPGQPEGVLGTQRGGGQDPLLCCAQEGTQREVLGQATCGLGQGLGQWGAARTVSPGQCYRRL